jgi:hypothetical protein
VQIGEIELHNPSGEVNYLISDDEWLAEEKAEWGSAGSGDGWGVEEEMEERYKMEIIKYQIRRKLPYICVCLVDRETSCTL